MKKIILSIILCSISMGLFAQKRGCVKLNIKGWGNDTIYVLKYIWGSEKEVLDTLFAKNGCMIYKAGIDDTTSVHFFSSKTVIPSHESKKFTVPSATAVQTIILPNSYEEIKGELMSNKLVYISTGSEYVIQSAQQRINQLSLMVKLDSLNTLIEFSRYNKLTPEQTNKLFHERNEVYSKMKAFKKNYILNNLNTQLAAEYLTMIGMEDLLILEPTLLEECRNGVFKK